MFPNPHTTIGVKKMKVAVSSTGKDLTANIDPRFGRCAYFIIADTQDMSFTAYDNENINLSGGAGIQAASFVASTGAKAVLTGNCGPKAMTAFTAAGVDVFTGQTGTVRETVERFKSGRLRPSTEPTVPEKAGSLNAAGNNTARGIGRCQGGTGRGMGGGRGAGMGGGGRGMGGNIRNSGGQD